MRSVLITACTLLLLEAVRADERLSQDFDTGAVLGECITVGCHVFVGSVITFPDDPGASIQLSVEEALYGIPAGTKHLDISYSNREGSGDSLAVWAGVPVASGQRFAILLRPNDGLPTRLHQAIFITSEEHRIEIIRSLTEKSTLLDRSPDLIPGVVTSLGRDSNPGLAGLVFSLLTRRTMATQPDLACELLLLMLSNMNMPAHRLENTAMDLAPAYGRLKDVSRELVLRRFTDLGEQQDAVCANAAYIGLAHIASYFPVRNSIPPATLLALQNNYQILLHNRSLPRNRPLEAGLGFKMQ